MTYTLLALIGVAVAAAVDLLLLRTKLLLHKAFWTAYAIIVFFQLLTNGWLTGRRIVQYDPDTIVGSDRVVWLGGGRILYAPVEDLLFGFGLVLTSIAAWVWLGQRSREPAPQRTGDEEREAA